MNRLRNVPRRRRIVIFNALLGKILLLECRHVMTSSRRFEKNLYSQKSYRRRRRNKEDEEGREKGGQRAGRQAGSKRMTEIIQIEERRRGGKGRGRFGAEYENEKAISSVLYSRLNAHHAPNHSTTHRNTLESVILQHNTPQHTGTCNTTVQHTAIHQTQHTKSHKRHTKHNTTHKQHTTTTQHTATCNNSTVRYAIACNTK